MLSATTDTMIVALRLKSDILVLPSTGPAGVVGNAGERREPGSTVFHRDHRRVVHQAYPRVQLHVVCDNHATQKHLAVQAKPAKNPPVQHPHHPDQLLLADLVEGFLSVIIRQAIRRGTLAPSTDRRRLSSADLRC